MSAQLCSALLMILCAREITANIQAYGCEEGWTNYEDHCYTVVRGPWDGHDSAKNVCTDLGANMASMWSPIEMAFVTALWQVAQSDVPYLWTGLRCSWSKTCTWEDRSSVSVYQKDTGEVWSVLDELSPVEGSTAGQCVVLTLQGTSALLACDESAGGVACKKPLPRVLTLPDVLNQSSPRPTGKLDTVHLFQRVLPPVLNEVPSRVDTPLDELEVTADTHCAFVCHSVPECRAIELNCITQSRCGTYQCLLFSDISI